MLGPRLGQQLTYCQAQRAHIRALNVLGLSGGQQLTFYQAQSSITSKFQEVSSIGAWNVVGFIFETGAAAHGLPSTRDTQVSSRKFHPAGAMDEVGLRSGQQLTSCQKQAHTAKTSKTFHLLGDLNVVYLRWGQQLTFCRAQSSTHR